MGPSNRLSPPSGEPNGQKQAPAKRNYAPPILPLAPAKFTGSVFLVGTQVQPECTNFAGSLESSTGSFVQSVAPSGAGSTPGMLGYMFLAAVQPSNKSMTTTPPYTCPGGGGDR